MPRLYMGEPLRHGLGLGVHQLQLIAGFNHNGGVRLRAYAQPVNTRWRWQGAVGFYTHLKALLMKRIDQLVVQLQ